MTTRRPGRQKRLVDMGESQEGIALPQFPGRRRPIDQAEEIKAVSGHLPGRYLAHQRENLLVKVRRTKFRQHSLIILHPSRPGSRIRLRESAGPRQAEHTCPGPG